MRTNKIILRTFFSQKSKIDVNMTINERFEELIKKLYNGNKRAFATTLGISPTVIENVVGKRRGKPSYDVIEKICANANVSPDWLLTGKGNMLREQTEQTESSSTQIDVTPSQMLEEIKALSVKIGHLEAENKMLREQVKNKRQYNPYPSVAEPELKY